MAEKAEVSGIFVTLGAWLATEGHLLVLPAIEKAAPECLLNHAHSSVVQS